MSNKNTLDLFNNPLTKFTSGFQFFINTMPSVNRYVSDNNLFSKLLGGSKSISEAQFDVDAPNALAHYKSRYLVALESLAHHHLANLSKEAEKDQLFMHQINQIPDNINGMAPTRAQIEADRNIVYINDIQTISLLQSRNPNFVDPDGTVAARNTTLRTLSNSLPSNIMTQWRTQSAFGVVTDAHRARALNNPILTYQRKQLGIKREALALAEIELGTIDPTQTSDLQIAAIKSKLTASQSHEAEKELTKSLASFETARDRNNALNLRTKSAIALMFPSDDLANFPEAHSHSLAGEFEKIIPALSVHFARISHPQFLTIEGALNSISFNTKVSAAVTILQVKETLAAMQMIKSAHNHNDATPANFTLQAITSDVVNLTDAQWLTKYPTRPRYKSQEDVYVLVHKICDTVDKFQPLLNPHFIAFPSPNPIERHPSKIIDIVRQHETAFGIIDPSKSTGKNNGPSLLANAASTSGSASAIVKHDPATFKGNVPGQPNSIVPRGGLNFGQMIHSSDEICHAHQTNSHSTKDCRAVKDLDLAPSKFHKNTLVIITTGKPVYFKRNQDGKGDGQKASGNQPGSKRQGSAKDANPAPAKDAKLDGNQGGGRGGGKGGGKDGGRGGGKDGGRGGKGGRGRQAQANNAQANSDCSYCLNARKVGGTSAVPENESLDHSIANCPRKEASLIASIANTVTTTLAERLGGGDPSKPRA